MVDRRDRIRVHIEGKEFSVVGGSFQEMLAAVKSLPGRRFMGDLKVWQLPGALADIQPKIESSGFQLEGGAEVGPVEAVPAPARSGSDRIRVAVQGRPLTVMGGGFQEMLAVVKSLPNRRFDGDSKTWNIDGDLPIIKQSIEAAGFQLEGAEDVSGAPGSPSSAMPPEFDPTVKVPPYEEPDFFGDDEVPPYEPPDWWDDDNAPPPPSAPPGWLEDAPEFLPAETPDFAEPSPPPVSPAPSGGARSGSDQIRIRIGGIPFVVTGGSFQAMLAAVKNLPGRRFGGQDKVWDIPAEVTIDGAKQKIEAAGFSLARD